MSGSEVQRIKFLNCSVVSFNSSIGFNSSPSTLSVTLAEDYDDSDNFQADDHTENDELGATQGGSAFTSGNPGTFAKFTIPGSDFEFSGIVTSYRRSKSSSGNLINVELSDPRIFLNQIPIVNDTNLNINTTGFQVSSWNIFCAPAIFSDPISLDWSVDGVRFDRLASAIETKLFSFYNTSYKIKFHESFYQNLAGGYRLKQQSSTVEDMINQASKDCGMDWFIDIGTGDGFNLINIKGIKRTNQYNFDDSNGLRTFIEDRQDRVSSWEIGRELREEPTVAVVVGDRVRTLWDTSPEGIYPRLCELGNGMVIDRPFVNLDYIYDQFALSSLATSIPTLNVKLSSSATTVSIQSDVDDFGNSKVKYPERSKGQSNSLRRGYIATENVLRAALHSKEAWATAVWYEYRNPANGNLYTVPYSVYNSFDIGYGFDAPSSNSTALFSMNPASIGVTGPDFDFEKGQPSLTSVITSNTNAEVETLKNSVYELTRQMAEENYGKKFICRLPISQICQDIGTSYEHNEKKIPIEYDITDSAPDIGFYSSTVSLNFPNSLLYSDSSSFKNQNGLFKAFAYINPASILTQFNKYSIDEFDRSEIIRSANNIDDINPSVSNSQTLLYAGLSVEPYRFDPRFALVTLNSPVKCGLSTYRSVSPGTRFTNGKIKTFSLITRQGFTTSNDRSDEFLELMSRIFSNLNIVTHDNANLKDPSTGKQLNVSFNNGVISVDYYYALQTSAIALQEHVGLSEYRLINFNRGVTHGGFYIPLQWNYIKYGPWVNGDAFSRPVNLIEDSKLNPWNYGNYNRMNEAGSIIAQRANTFTHTIAYATISVEGYPEFNLGDRLLTSENDDLCNISDISMNFGTDGIKTTYKFKSFFGPNGFTKRAEISAISNSSVNSFSNRQDSIKVGRIYDDILAKIYEKSGGPPGIAQGNSTNRAGFADTLVASSSPVNNNPSISNINGLNAKRSAEATNDYKNIAIANLSTIFTPFTTYPNKANTGQAPTIEGGIIS